MKSYDLKPTKENIVNTFLNDEINRNKDIFSFILALDTLEDSCSIALDGNWGSGKTFFVKQVKMVLDAANKQLIVKDTEEIDKINNVRKKALGDKMPDLQQHFCVYYDAWENDNDDDPIISLIYEIMKSTGTEYSFKNIDFINIGANIFDSLLECGSKYLPFVQIPKIPVAKIIEELRGNDPIETLKQQKNFEDSIHKFFNSLLVEKGNRLVIFIDELDRCKPSYAVRLLEKIKHYFSDDRITVVFSVNSKQLQHTIKKYYGDDFDASRYLDRFFDLRMTLPPPLLNRFYDKINFNGDFNTDDIICNAVIKTYNFELREIARFLRIIKIAIHTYTRNAENRFGFSDENAKIFCMYYIVPIMIGLRVCDLKHYIEFIEGRDCSPMFEIIKHMRRPGILDFMLNDNESFDDRSNFNFVKVEDKLKEVYEAIFAKIYSRHDYSCNVGKMFFDKDTKNDLLRVVGLFSPYTNFE